VPFTMWRQSWPRQTSSTAFHCPLGFSLSGCFTQRPVCPGICEKYVHVQIGKSAICIGGPPSRNAHFARRSGGTAFAAGLAQPKLTLALGKRERRLAERVGFEPTVEFPLHTLSKRAP